MRAAPTLAGIFLLAVAAPALAQECVPSDANPEWCFYVAPITPLPCIRDLAAIVWGYVDNDNCQQDGCLFSIWIYQETNGIEWLQRNDEALDNTCGGMIDSDLFLF